MGNSASSKPMTKHLIWQQIQKRLTHLSGQNLVDTFKYIQQATQDDSQLKDCYKGFAELYSYKLVCKTIIQSNKKQQIKEIIYPVLESQHLSQSTQEELLEITKRIIVSKSTDTLLLSCKNSYQEQVNDKLEETNTQKSTEFDIQVKELRIKQELRKSNKKMKEQINKLIHKLALQTGNKTEIDRQKSQNLEQEFNHLQKMIENYKQFTIKKDKQQITHKEHTWILQSCVELQEQVRCILQQRKQQNMVGQNTLGINKQNQLQEIRCLFQRIKQQVFEIKQISNEFEKQQASLKSKITNLQDQIKSLNSASKQGKQRFQSYSKNLNEQLHEQKRMRLSLQKQLQQKKKKQEQINKKLKNFTDSKRKQNQKLQEEIASLKKNMQDKEQQKQQVTRESNDNSRIFQIQKSEFTQKEKQFDRKIQQMKQQNSQAISKLRRELKEAINAKQQMQVTKNTQLQRLNNHISSTIEKLTSQLQMANLKISQQTQIISKITKEKEQIENRRKQIQNQSYILQCQKQKYIQQISTLERNLMAAQDNLSSKNFQIEEEKREKSFLLTRLSSIQTHIQANSRLSSQILELQEKIKGQQQLIQQIKLERYEKFFVNDILDNLTDKKKFIISTLENRYHSEVILTRFLCKYDALNLTNVHKYIDDKNCILTLGKLTNGYIVAGFSASPFKSQCSGTDAIIMGVSTQQAFYLKANQKKSIIYDSFFIIYGNSELRFKSNNLGVFTNLGVSNGFFESRGHNAPALFGTPLRDNSLETYEMYQVVFRVPPPVEVVQ